MRKLIVAVLITTSTTAFASDKDVGYCAAFHLAQGNTKYADRVILKGKDMFAVKAAAREWMDLALTNESSAIKRGTASCFSLGLKA